MFEVNLNMVYNIDTERGVVETTPLFMKKTR